MCGIAGQISADPNKIAANYPAYCRMQKSLARRGPDQRGMYPFLSWKKSHRRQE